MSVNVNSQMPGCKTCRLCGCGWLLRVLPTATRELTLTDIPSVYFTCIYTSQFIPSKSSKSILRFFFMYNTICWRLRLCEADRGIFFTISLMERVYKNKNWMEGSLKWGPKPEGYQNQSMNGEGSQNFWRYAPLVNKISMDMLPFILSFWRHYETDLWSTGAQK